MSVSYDYKTALKEWVRHPCNPFKVDKQYKENCICGSCITNIFIIVNVKNGNIAFVGGACKKKVIDCKLTFEKLPNLMNYNLFEKVEYKNLNIEEYLLRCRRIIEGITGAIWREQMFDDMINAKMAKINNENKRLQEEKKAKQKFVFTLNNIIRAKLMKIQNEKLRVIREIERFKANRKILLNNMICKKISDLQKIKQIEIEEEMEEQRQIAELEREIARKLDSVKKPAIKRKKTMEEMIEESANQYWNSIFV